MKTALKALVLLATSLALPASAWAEAQEPLEFDRLDGKGPSAKKVDVIEWEGNLEFHVYPKGSLAGLGLKYLKKKDGAKGDSVMVVQYRFKGVGYKIIRRATVSLPLPENFKTFIDSSDPDMDKVMVSGNTLAGVKVFKTDPEPTQLFPDHYGTKEGAEADRKQLKELDEKAKENQPSDANPDLHVGFKAKEKAPAQKKALDENGNIPEFSF